VPKCTGLTNKAKKKKHKVKSSKVKVEKPILKPDSKLKAQKQIGPAKVAVVFVPASVSPTDQRV
jgi:hypothetical protein